MAQAYGVILTAWSAAGIVGPQVFACPEGPLHASTRPPYSFFAAAGFLAVGLLLFARVGRKRTGCGSRCRVVGRLVGSSL